jgi:hypothetical protein
LKSANQGPEGRVVAKKKKDNFFTEKSVKKNLD